MCVVSVSVIAERMTNTTLPGELLKSNVIGQVRTPRERREGLLDGFERKRQAAPLLTLDG